MKRLKKIAAGILVFTLIMGWCFMTYGRPQVSAGSAEMYLGDLEVNQNNSLMYFVDTTERNTQIKIGGKVYEKGIVTHPGTEGPAELTYSISGLGYSVFRAVGGKDASAGFEVGGDSGINGTKVQLQVYVDGVLKADSGTLAYPETYEFDVDITGANELKLVVMDGGDSIYCDATAWAGARLIGTEVSPETGDADSLWPILVLLIVGAGMVVTLKRIKIGA